jgi:hypothetical protein
MPQAFLRAKLAGGAGLKLEFLPMFFLSYTGQEKVKKH